MSLNKLNTVKLHLKILIAPPKLKSAREIKPFFIIGSGRSGNTLLRRILNANETIYIPPETYILGPSIKEYNVFRFLGWPLACRLVLSQFMLSQDFDTFPTQILRPLYEKLHDYSEQHRSYADIIDAFYMYMAAIAKPNAEVWGDKTPINSQYLPQIDSVFPEAKYIHIIRNGVDVVSSYLAMGRYQSIESAARRWLDATTKCRSFGMRNTSRYKEVRYENLVTQPFETTKDICSFLDIKYSEEMIHNTQPDSVLGDIRQRPHLRRAAEPIDGTSIGKGMDKFSKTELEKLKELIGEHMQALGYDTSF